MKKGFHLVVAILIGNFSLYAQVITPCYFDEYTDSKSNVTTNELIQSAIQDKFTTLNKKSSDGIRTIPIVVHVIHNGGSENISLEQVRSQIQILNEDFGKFIGTNGDGDGVDTKVRFCLANKDPNGDCTDGVVRVKSSLTNHQSYQRALLKELSFWDNERYLNIYVVRIINGNVGGYSSFPSGPADEDGVVVRHSLFGNTGTASSKLGRTTTHELGHWFGLYHTFNNGCGIDLCTDGDFVCDTPPQSKPNYNCNTENTCSNDIPDIDDQTANYMNYTPDVCKNMFTEGQRKRIDATLDVIRTLIWSDENLVFTGCDSNYIAPTECKVVADFVALNTNLCSGNSVNLMDKSLNNPTNWQWLTPGGTPDFSTIENPTITYDSVGTYSVTLIAGDSAYKDYKIKTEYITVVDPGIGDSLSFKEDFDNGIYPPSTLTINNLDDGVTWELDSSASVSGNYSIKINNLINTNYGSSDELILPHFDLTTANPDSNVYMSFNWAYAKSDATFSDDLLVLLSTDCGVNFTRVLYKTQNSLATGPTQTTEFIPDSNQWKYAFILLNRYRNESYVQLKIVNITDGGNNLYLDNIYVGDGSAPVEKIIIGENRHGDFSLYPNPALDNTTFEYWMEQNDQVEITIWAISGQKIKTYYKGSKDKGNHKITLSTKGIVPGVYFVNLQTDKLNKSLKLLIVE
jgi:PKD repeat protein